MNITASKAFVKFSQQHPLCGSLQDEYDMFQYILVGKEANGIEISSPAKLAYSYMLKEFDIVNLHLIFKLGERCFAKGQVTAIRTDKATNEQVFQLSLIEEHAFDYLCNLTWRDDKQFYIEACVSSAPELLAQFCKEIKECILLKKGVAVYLKHLSAYFSRLIGYHHSKYPQFNLFFFDTALLALMKKIEKLNSLAEKLSQESPQTAFTNLISMKEIFELVESEVNLDVINLTFTKGDHLPYMIAIKELEEKLYWNYNTLIMLYEASKKYV